MPLLAANARELYASLVIAALVIAALVLGQQVLIPLAVSIIVAFVLSPIVNWMAAVGVPRAVTSTLAVTTLLIGIVFGSIAIGNQLVSLAGDLAVYKENLVAKMSALSSASASNSAMRRATEAIASIEVGINRQRSETTQAGAPSAQPTTPRESEPVPVQVVKDGSSSAIQALEYVTAPLVQTGLALLFALFILLQSHDLRDRLARIAGTNNLSGTTAALSDAAEKLSQLFLAQAFLNAAYGIVVALLVWSLGLPNAALWGLLAALMRYVPFVGSIIAIAPPVLLAAAVDPGWSLALVTFGLLVASEFVVGQFVEPVVLGKRAGLSPFSMLLTASFWAMLWGPIGLILAAPLTITIVVLGRYVKGLEFASVLLGDQPALSPAEQLYHRLLANDALAASEQLDHYEHAPNLSLAADTIVLPALQLAANDLDEDRIDADRANLVRRNLAQAADLFPVSPGDAARTKRDLSMTLIPARSALDVAAVEFLARTMQVETGLVAQEITSATGLTAIAQLRGMAGNPPDVIVLVSVGSNDGAYVPIMAKRLAQHFPTAKLAVMDIGRTLDGTRQLNTSHTTLAHFARVDELIAFAAVKRPDRSVESSAA